MKYVMYIPRRYYRYNMYRQGRKTTGLQTHTSTLFAQEALAIVGQQHRLPIIMICVVYHQVKLKCT